MANTRNVSDKIPRGDTINAVQIAEEIYAEKPGLPKDTDEITAHAIYIRAKRAIQCNRRGSRSRRCDVRAKSHVKWNTHMQKPNFPPP